MTTISSFQLETQRGKDSPDALLAFLRDHRGSEVEISLKQVSTLSGPQIEVLLSGYNQWQSEQRNFSLIESSPELTSRMISFGLPSQLFSKEAE